MEPGEPSEYVVATYDEIRLRFGLGGTDHARIKAKRRKWGMEPRNNPGSIARVRVPRAEWDAAQEKARSLGTAPEEHGERSPGTAPPEVGQSRKVNPLEGLIAAFREEQNQLRGDLTEAKVAAEKARAELVAERIRANRAEREREEARIKAAAAEGELRGLRDAMAREARQREQLEATLKAAETQRDAAQAVRDEQVQVKQQPEQETLFGEVIRRVVNAVGSRKPRG